MGEEDLNTLFYWLTTKNTEPPIPIRPDPDLREGVYQFLAGEVIHTISQCNFDKTLSIHLLNAAPPFGEKALCLDVQIAYQESTKAFGRLVISPDFRRSWKERYAERRLSKPMSPSLTEKIHVTLRLVGGKTSLPLEEWKSVSCGDFLLLDECSLEPGEEKSRVWILLNESPLFRARIKPGNLKILEFPLYHEVPMATESPDDLDE
jgi:flagellar motor switch protein FliN/FliY